MADKKYRLKIRNDGSVKYLMEDGRFWNVRSCPHLSIKLFDGRIEAERAYLDWAHKYITIAADWIPQWEEVTEWEDTKQSRRRKRNRSGRCSGHTLRKQRSPGK